jgi:hypothetical protein
MPEGTVESAHRALIGIRAQDLLGEPAATGPQLNSAGDSLASGEVQGRYVKVDGSADQFGEDWREVQVQYEPGSRGEGRRVGQEPFNGSAQATDRPSVQQPGAACGRVLGDFLSGRVPQIP